MSAGIRRRYRISSWALLLETALSLCVAACAKHLLPFRVSSRILGAQANQSTSPPLPTQLERDLVWAFGLFQRIRPRPLCLTEVMALSLMLRRRGLRGTAFLGVAAKAPFQAHAWMRCGERILPRRQDLAPYRVIALFEPGSQTHGGMSR